MLLQAGKLKQAFMLREDTLDVFDRRQLATSLELHAYVQALLLLIGGPGKMRRF